MNETSEGGRDISAEASLSISKSGGGGKDSSKGMGVAAAGGYASDKSSSSEAVTRSIKAGGNLLLSAGKDATFEGTRISAGGDTDVGAGAMSASMQRATPVAASHSVCRLA